MRQLFRNLISNGLKYKKPDKPVNIRIESSRSGDDQYVISIRDDGIGFDLKHQDRIFQPFKRLHSDHDIKGSGIGLFICKKIVDSHFGSIVVESEPGLGSTFRISLPARQINSANQTIRPVKGNFER